MNIKKTFIISSIVVGSLALSLIFLFYLNNLLGKCNGLDEKVSKVGKCFYYRDTCKDKEEATIIEGAKACLYSSDGFLNNNLIKWIVIIMGFGWIIIFIIFLINVARTGKPLDITVFKKEDFVEPKIARTLWARRFSERNSIPIINNEYKESAFNFYKVMEPWQKGKEWFYQFQCQVLEGTNPGVYTVVTSISRGVKWILGDGYRERNCLYDDFKISRNRPLYTSEDPNERMLEQLWQTHPERARALAEQMIERRITSPPIPEPEEPPQQVIIKQPRRVPYNYRRRYY